MSQSAEPPMSSIQARIAALNLGQVGRTPTSLPDQTVPGRKAKGPPPPLPKRPADHRSQSANNPPILSNGVSSEKPVGNTPAGRAPLRGLRPPPPPPGSSASYEEDEEPRPSLPPRRPSEQNGRRGSTDSLASVASARSSMSAVSGRTSLSNMSRGPRIRAPDHDSANVPPLPQRRKKIPEEDAPPMPVRPAVPSLNAARVNAMDDEAAPPLPGRPGLPARLNRPSQSRPLPPPTPNRSATTSAPPVPMSSRPDLSKLQASKPKLGASAGSCLICRDFSAPDAHAARFPRESIPSTDVNWIAHNLTSPFSSTTDKARAIFTWLHHNIEYNTVAFFSGNLKSSTPNSTLDSGLAVCEGYAALFTALAAAAGLESVVVCGHGKGFGFTNIDPNLPLPPKDVGGHAWNAVRLDGGEWKLIDACWGAGHVQGKGMPYVKKFAPERFTQSNEDFGIDHYPEHDRHFYRADGRSLSWREYLFLDATKPKTYSGWESEHGLSTRSLEPKVTSIDTSPHGDAMVRFMYTKVCPHWDNIAHGKGKPYLLFLELRGHERGDQKEQRAITQSDGYHSWIDVPKADLGAPGQQVKLVFMQQLDGEDARGLTAEGYKRWQSEPRGKSWSWGILAVWDLV